MVAVEQVRCPAASSSAAIDRHGVRSFQEPAVVRSATGSGVGCGPAPPTLLFADSAPLTRGFALRCSGPLNPTEGRWPQVQRPNGRWLQVQRPNGRWPSVGFTGPPRFKLQGRDRMLADASPARTARTHRSLASRSQPSLTKPSLTQASLGTRRRFARDAIFMFASGGIFAVD